MNTVLLKTSYVAEMKYKSEQKHSKFTKFLDVSRAGKLYSQETSIKAPSDFNCKVQVQFKRLEVPISGDVWSIYVL